MAIVDQFGRPTYISRRFAHAADLNRNRGPQFLERDRSIDELIPAHDRKTLVALSKRLFTNMGAPMRAAIRQKADYAIGRAWVPLYNGSDKDVGREVCSWLKNVWFPLADVRGGVFNWWLFLRLVSHCLDRDGEAFILLTSSLDGTFPRVQSIPSYLVASDASLSTVDSGPYVGLRIVDGIIYNAQMAAVAYRVHDAEGNFTDVSARDLIHIYDPTYAEQGRGLPAFTHALDDMKSMLQSTEYERIKQQVISSILLVEQNEIGGPDYSDPFAALSKDTDDATGIAQEQYGPAVHYFRANSGGGLQTVTHDSPGDVWEAFHDRLIRSAIAGVGWSYSLVWKPAGQGTAERTEIERARRSVEERIGVLKHLGLRIITYVVAQASAARRIPMPGNMLAWDFTVPPRLTVDDGREAKAQIEAYSAGHLNETEIQGWKGRDVEDHYRERAVELGKRELIRMEVEEELQASTGKPIQISPQEMGAAGSTSNFEPEAGTPQENEDESTQPERGPAAQR